MSHLQQDFCKETLCKGKNKDMIAPFSSYKIRDVDEIRDVFRTLSNICDGAFLQKWLKS